jgi:two-component system, LytTR family, response regulator
MNLRVLIVDDEDLGRAVLRELLAPLPGVEVVGEARNGFEAVKAAEELRPNLLLLDIHMPKLSGFEVLELLREPVDTIFVTAHDEHALRAFEVHAVDYLLKPVEPERLAVALERARARLERGQALPAAAELAESARPPGSAVERILIREEGQIHILAVGKIDYVEAKDDYLAFHADKKVFKKQQTLSALEQQLDGRRFVRIHRSYVLNLDRLAGLDLYAKDSWVARLQDGTRLPVSRSGHARLQELL